MTDSAPKTNSYEQEVADFRIDDLFMSRTDDRGVILSGNQTFQRLSGYGWGELLGAPHKTIRHPDMPKCVFRVFWERLKAGKPVGAYVKNRAKDGRYYWVFAIALPVEGGFVSVRLKPSSPIFETVKGVYAALLDAEHKGMSIEGGVEMIDDFLKKHGRTSYRDAMAAWVRSEIASRRSHLGRKPDPVLDGLEELKSCILKIGNELDEVRGTFESIRGTPTNLRIQASRFGEKAITIQIISQNYDLLTKEIEAANATMGQIYESLLQVLDEDSFGLAAVSLLHEAFRRFESEDGLPEGISMEVEAQIIQPHTRNFSARADVMLKRTEELVVQVRQLQRIVSGLAVTRVMCRIEEAGLSGDSGGIADIVDRLLQFQTKVMGCIEHIDTECRNAHRSMTRLAANFSAVPDEMKPQGGKDRRRAPREPRLRSDSAA
ncbi:MAG: hypothetical protein CML65_09150 [Rhodobacteraceae bacterium]|nr:hypothetical protein [Paracoccaceae bacterium]